MKDVDKFVQLPEHGEHPRLVRIQLFLKQLSQLVLKNLEQDGREIFIRPVLMKVWNAGKTVI